MAGGNQPHRRCSPCITCRYVTTLRRVYTRFGALLALAISTGAIYTILLIHQPPLADLIKKTNPWRWTDKEEACFQELKKKISSTSCLGVPRHKGEIILVINACDVGGGGYPIPVAGA